MADRALWGMIGGKQTTFFEYAYSSMVTGLGGTVRHRLSTSCPSSLNQMNSYTPAGRQLINGSLDVTSWCYSLIKPGTAWIRCLRRKGANSSAGEGGANKYPCASSHWFWIRN